MSRIYHHPTARPRGVPGRFAATPQRAAAIAAAFVAAVCLPQGASAQELAVAFSENGPGARVGISLGERWVLDAGVDGSLWWGTGPGAADSRGLFLPIELRHRFGAIREDTVVPTLGAGLAWGTQQLEQGDDTLGAWILEARGAVGAEYWSSESFAVYADAGFAAARVILDDPTGVSRLWTLHAAWRLGMRFRL